jgi:hypothetical protein
MRFTSAVGRGRASSEARVRGGLGPHRHGAGHVRPPSRHDKLQDFVLGDVPHTAGRDVPSLLQHGDAVSDREHLLKPVADENHADSVAAPESSDHSTMQPIELHRVPAEDPTARLRGEIR